VQHYFGEVPSQKSIFANFLCVTEKTQQNSGGNLEFCDILLVEKWVKQGLENSDQKSSRF